jgi:ribose 5-phosphate isomerase B
MAERIAIAADHAGVDLKDTVGTWLVKLGYEPVDLGTHGNDSVDYPDFAAAAGRAIQNGDVERAIVVCGSGAGACIAANKLRGIRAAVCHDTYSAHQVVEHDDVNVLCLGSRIIGEALAEEIVETWLNAKFTAEERHARRVGKINDLERDGVAVEAGS